MELSWNHWDTNIPGPNEVCNGMLPRKRHHTACCPFILFLIGLVEDREVNAFLSAQFMQIRDRDAPEHITQHGILCAAVWPNEEKHRPVSSACAWNLELLKPGAEAGASSCEQFRRPPIVTDGHNVEVL
jgi:hypothetical protein